MTRSVLVVEDESIVALDLENRLKGLGFHVVGHGRSGEEAQTLAEAHRPDVILMDIQIKGPIDGIETAGIIKRRLGIPSIFLTAYSDSESLERAKRSQAYGYLLKPFQERELLIAIELALYKYEAERELESNRRLLRTTLNSIDEGVITTDSHDRVLLLNKAAEGMTGWYSSDVVGAPLEQVFHTESVSWDAPHSAEGPSTDRYTLVDRRGGTRPVEVTMNTLETDRSDGAAKVVVFRDVSEPLRYEKSLVDAKEAAEAAAKAKSDFLARMSHELRTPLNSIIGMAQLAKDMEIASPVDEYLDIVLGSAHSLMALITDVLDYAKYESGEITLRRDIVETAALFDTVARTHALDAHSRELRLTTVVPPDLPSKLYGDEQRLRQIFGNLLSNAIKYTNNGHIVLAVEEAGRGDGTTTLRCTVEDTGVGIPSDRLETIFDDFSQLDDPATRNAGGSGLGLAIVNRLVKAMSGRIDVQSTVGEGTTVAVELSLGIAEERPVREISGKTEAGETRRLIVDDPLLLRCLGRWKPDGIVPSSSVERFTGADLIVTPRERYREVVATLGERRDDAHHADGGAVPTVVVVSKLSEDAVTPSVDRNEAPHRLLHVREPLETAVCAGLLFGELGDTEHVTTPLERTESADGDEAPETVLLVDDDNVNLMVNRKLIEQLGYSVEAVNRGEKAITVLREKAFTLACIDIEMPEMDGWELDRKIRSGDAGVAAQEMPRIALTGYDNSDIRDALTRSGFATVLTKPFSVRELESTITDIVGTKSGATARSETEESLYTAIQRRFGEGDLERVLELVKDARNTVESPLEKETLFRLQLALRRRDDAAAQKLIAELGR